jgi:SAM-dependent methyltransferase
VMEVIDPQYEGPPEGVTVHPCLLDLASAAPLAGQFDALVSSHTLEHFPEFNNYFRAARMVLKPGGQLFTSVPNQEFGFAKAHGSMLSFEHPSVCTNLHWIALFYRNGFQVEHVQLFKGHSIMICARRVEVDIKFSLQARELSQALLDDYTRATLERLERIRAKADGSKENWLFGAHNNAQVRDIRLREMILRYLFLTLLLAHFPIAGALYVRPRGGQVLRPFGQLGAQARQAHVRHFACMPQALRRLWAAAARGRAAAARVYQHWQLQ